MYDEYVQDVLYCYDKNSNGQLDKDELKNMFKSITDESVKCEAKGAQVDNSQLIASQADRKTVQTWFGDKQARLTLLYSKSRDGCNSAMAK
jgi:H2-forming N5,N10-methylenetetrahydromethanopterin dehydrogenase-like enzyme